jgi:hypothetical protein
MSCSTHWNASEMQAASHACVLHHNRDTNQYSERSGRHLMSISPLNGLLPAEALIQRELGPVAHAPELGDGIVAVALLKAQYLLFCWVEGAVCPNMSPVSTCMRSRIAAVYSVDQHCTYVFAQRMSMYVEMRVH